MPQPLFCDEIRKIATIITEGKIGSSGAFSSLGNEFQLTQPDTPQPWRNVFGNDEYTLELSQNGIGYSFLRDGTIITPSPWQEKVKPGRFIFIRDNDTKEQWSASWYPSLAPLESFQATHRLGSTEVISTAHEITTRVTFFVPPQGACEIWQVELENTGKEKRRLSVFAVTDWADADRAFFHDNGIIAPSISKPIAAYITLDHAVDSYDCDAEQFIGTYRTIANPQAVEDGKCARSESSQSPIGALQKSLTIGARSSSKFNVILGVAKFDTAPSDASAIRSIKKLSAPYRDSSDVTRFLKEVTQQWEEKIGKIRMRSPDPDLNSAINYWLSYQSLQDNYPTYLVAERAERLRAELSRGECKPKEIEALFEHQYRDGSFSASLSHQQPDEEQQAVFAAVALLCEYVQETGNLAILNNSVAYADSGSASLHHHFVRGLRQIIEHERSEQKALRFRSIALLRMCLPLLGLMGEHELAKRYGRLIDTPITGSKNDSAETLAWHLLASNKKQDQARLLEQMVQKNPVAAMKSVRGAATILSSLFQGDHAETAITLTSRLLSTSSNQIITARRAEPYFISEQNTDNYLKLDGIAAGQICRCIIESCCGVQATYGGLKIDPHIPRSWRQLDIVRVFRGATYHIRILNPLRRTSGVERMTVNGLRTTGNVIRPFNTGNHFVEIILG